MSKIKVDEVESGSSNVKLSPKGTGLVKVKAAGGADGTLQLNSSGGSNAVKIKSPAHSAGISHTIILPDNNAAVDGHLHVKSVTGSGSTAVGQLEFKVFPTLDTSNLDASNFTTGKLPSSIMPATTSSQAALKLLSTTTVTSPVSYIDLTGLTDNKNYKIIAKKLLVDTDYAYPFINFLDASGNILICDINDRYGYSPWTYTRQNIYYQNNLMLNHNGSHWGTERRGGFIMEFNTGEVNVNQEYFFLTSFRPSYGYPMLDDKSGHIAAHYSNTVKTIRIYPHNVFSPTPHWDVGTEIVFYEYLK